jgi:hypothetical protein
VQGRETGKKILQWPTRRRRRCPISGDGDDSSQGRGWDSMGMIQAGISGGASRKI